MSKKLTMEKIRPAILKNRGGHENATDQELMFIWRALDGETQSQYLDSVKEIKNAHSPGTKKQV